MLGRFAEISLRLVSLNCREDAKQVLCRHTLLEDLEHLRSEHVSAGLLHVDCDSTNDADFDVRDGFNNSFDVLLCDAVERFGELGRRLFALLDFVEVRLEGLYDVEELVVESVSPVRHLHFQCLVSLRFPLIRL
jgi:hypothetical protein